MPILPPTGPELVRRTGVSKAKSSYEKRSTFGKYAHGTFTGLESGLTGFPTGAYTIGRDVAHDTKLALTGRSPDRTGPLLKNIALSEYNSYRHLGRNHDLSGPITDALALLTAGAGAATRVSKGVSAVSKAAKAERAAKAEELIFKDSAASIAHAMPTRSGKPDWNKAANMLNPSRRAQGKRVIPSHEISRHYHQNKEYLNETQAFNTQGKYANTPPKDILKGTKKSPTGETYGRTNAVGMASATGPSHPLYDFYAQRYPEHISDVTRARKAALAQPLYKRPILAGKPGNKKRTGLYAPTSPNPLFRYTRRGIEAIRPYGGKLPKAERSRDYKMFSSNREIRKESQARSATQKRMFAPGNIRVGPSGAKPHSLNPVQKVADVPVSLLRMGMWLRPRYYAQNIAQTAQMLATDPIYTARSMKLAGQLHKTNKPLYGHVRSVTGEAQAGAIAAGTAPGFISRKTAPFVARIPKVGKQLSENIANQGIQGTMGYYANIPESHVRMLQVLNELQKHHRDAGNLSDLTTEHINRYMQSVRKHGVMSPEHLPLRRAREEVGDFSRLYDRHNIPGHKPFGMSERDFIRTQIPIFYPMFKALSRYGVRFPSEHAILSAEGLALGKAGKKEQSRLLGPLPFWASYLIPKGAGDPNAKRTARPSVRNPANLYNLQPGTDILRQASAPFRTGGSVPGVSLLQEMGPFPNLTLGMLTGHDPQTGFPIKPFSKKTYRQHPGLNKNIINVPAEYVQGLPFAGAIQHSLGMKPHLRSFVPATSGTQSWEQELFGSGFLSRTAKDPELNKQAAREKRYGYGRKPRKHKGGWGGSFSP